MNKLLRPLKYVAIVLVYVYLVVRAVIGPPLYQHMKPAPMQDRQPLSGSPTALEDGGTVCIAENITAFGFPFQLNDTGTCSPRTEVNDDRFAQIVDGLFAVALTLVSVTVVYLLIQEDRQHRPKN